MPTDSIIDADDFEEHLESFAAEASPIDDLANATRALCKAAATFEQAVIRLLQEEPDHLESVFDESELRMLRLSSAVVTNWRGFLNLEEE